MVALSRIMGTMKKTLVFSLIIGFCLAFLAGASLIPDPCDGAGSDDCCQSHSPAPTCATVCCNGIVADPVELFVLAPPVRREIQAMVVEYPPIFTPSEPPDRPPAAA
jgi:hypothetical protein